jgi:hypothetical protein
MKVPDDGRLDGCRAKLDRAQEHLDSLDREVRPFLDAQPHALSFVFYPEDDGVAVLLEQFHVPPIRWGTVVGDVLHNARSSLDHLVYQLVPRGKVHNRHQFPIVDSSDRWEQAVSPVAPKTGRNKGVVPRGQLDCVHPDCVAHIERIQPYQPSTGHPRLAALRDLSNTDKHRLIHSRVFAIMRTPALEVPVPIKDVVLPTSGTTLAGKAHVASFRYFPIRPLTPEMTVDVKMEFTLSLAFEDPKRRVSLDMNELAATIDGTRNIIEHFTQALPPNP